MVAMGRSETKGQRFAELDALRGVAALAVGVSHHLTIFSDSSHAHIIALGRILKWSPLYPLTAGYESVVLFFVLSGFVLTLPYAAGRSDTYPVFFLRRVMRLYPPYLASVVLALVARSLFFHEPPSDLGPTFAEHWQSPATARIVLDFIVMIHHFNFGVFNPVLWSLVVEMRVSLLFPLVALVATRLRPSRALLIAATGTLLRIAGGRVFRGVVATDLLNTLEFVGMFIVGGVLAANLKPILSVLGRLSVRQTSALTILAWACYAYGRALTHVVAPVGDWPIVAGAGLFIVLSVGAAPVRRTLNHVALKFFGKISYSYYLIHFVVLYAAVHAGDRWLSTPVLVLASLPLGVIGATLLHYAVERPSIEIGRRMSVAMRPRVAARHE